MRIFILGTLLTLLATPGYAKDYFESAQAYQQQGEINAAVIELKNLLRDQPDHQEGRLLLGKLYLAQGNYPGAEKELSNARSLNSTDPRLPLLLAQSLLAQGRAQQAAEQFPLQAPNDPDLASEYWIIKGDIHRAEGAIAEAETAYKAAQEHGALQVAQLRLVSLALMRHQPDQALALIEAAKPDSQGAMFKRFAGEAYLLKREPEAALEAFRASMALLPSDPQAALGEARALMLQGNREQARTAVDSILERVPQWPRALTLSAMIHLQDADAEEAKRIVDPLLARSPKEPELLYLAAHSNLSLGNLEQATRQLNRYIALKEDRGARLTLANLYQQQGQLTLAAQTLTPLLDADQPDGEAYALLGAIKLRDGDGEAAAEAFRLAMKGGGEAQVARPLALSELINGDSQVAIERLEGLAAQGADPRTDALLIRAYLLNEQTETARKLLDQRLDGQESPLLYRLIAANVEMRLNDLEAAKRHFDQALNEAPQSLSALMGKAQIAVQQKQLKTAAALYQRAMAAAPDELAPVQAYATLLFQRNRPEEAVKVTRDFMEAAERDLTATRFHLSVLKHAQSLQALEVALAEASTRFPDSPELKLVAAEFAFSQRDVRKADRLLDAINREHREFWPGWIAKIQRLLEQNEYQEALTRLDTLPERVNAHPAVLLLRGDALYGRNDLDGARAAYEHVYGLAASAEVIGRLTRLDVSAGNTEQAVARLQQHHDRYSQDSVSAMTLAALHLQLGDHDAAINVYQQVIQVQPQNAAAWNNLAWLYQLESDSRAVETATRALELEPESAAVMDTTGWIFLGAGRHWEGLSLLKKAAEGLPENLSVQYHYAAALAMNGEKEKARMLLRSLLKADDFPEKEEAIKLSGELEEKP